MRAPLVLGDGPARGGTPREGTDAAVLAGLVRATDEGRPVAVVDGGWPRAVLDPLVTRLRDTDLPAGRLVLFSSGSTGRPRGIVRTLTSWQASAAPLTDLLGLTSDDVVGLPGPIASTLYSYGGWHAHQVGAGVVTQDGWAQQRADVSVTHLVPGRLGWLLDQARAGDLPRLRHVVLGGDRVSPHHLRWCRDLGLRVLNYYGAAETSFVLVDPDGAGYRPFPGCAVEVADGQLWVRSPYLFERYLDPGDDGPARRRGDAVSVGDRARVSGDGDVDVLGRPGAVTTGGHTVHLADLSADLRALPGVLDAHPVPVPHPHLGQVVVAVYVGPASPAELRDAARSLPRPGRPVRWVPVPSIPRTDVGKADEAALRALAEDRS